MRWKLDLVNSPSWWYDNASYSTFLAGVLYSFTSVKLNWSSDNSFELIISEFIDWNLDFEDLKSFSFCILRGFSPILNIESMKECSLFDSSHSFFESYYFLNKLLDSIELLESEFDSSKEYSISLKFCPCFLRGY